MGIICSKDDASYESGWMSAQKNGSAGGAGAAQGAAGNIFEAAEPAANPYNNTGNLGVLRDVDSGVRN
eukprot:g3328.t1